MSWQQDLKIYVSQLQTCHFLLGCRPAFPLRKRKVHCVCLLNWPLSVSTFCFITWISAAGNYAAAMQTESVKTYTNSCKSCLWNFYCSFRLSTALWWGLHTAHTHIQCWCWQVSVWKKRVRWSSPHTDLLVVAFTLPLLSHLALQSSCTTMITFQMWNFLKVVVTI